MCGRPDRRRQALPPQFRYWGARSPDQSDGSTWTCHCEDRDPDGGPPRRSSWGWPSVHEAMGFFCSHASTRLEPRRILVGWGPKHSVEITRVHDRKSGLPRALNKLRCLCLLKSLSAQVLPPPVLDAAATNRNFLVLASRHRRSPSRTYDEPGRNNRFGPVFLDLNIRQLEIVRGSPCEDGGPIRYADNEAQGTRKLHIAVGDDGHSVVILVKYLSASRKSWS